MHVYPQWTSENLLLRERLHLFQQYICSSAMTQKMGCDAKCLKSGAKDSNEAMSDITDGQLHFSA